MLKCTPFLFGYIRITITKVYTIQLGYVIMNNHLCFCFVFVLYYVVDPLI
jgi:hypothetical protein